MRTRLPPPHHILSGIHYRIESLQQWFLSKPLPHRLLMMIVYLLAIHQVAGAVWDWWRARRSERTFLKLKIKAPEAITSTWTSQIIPSPTLLSHVSLPSLLPPNSQSLPPETKYLTCYDPSTGYHLETIPLPSPAQLQATIKRAHDAAPGWRKTSFGQRRRLLRCFKEWFLRDLRIVVRVGARDTGKTEVDSFLGEILTTLSKIDYLIKHGESALRAETRSGNILLAHKVSKVHYEPLGLVCAIVSWNYPVHNALSPILAAIFSGNSIVLKCSEQVYWSSLWIVNALKGALEICGMDKEVVQLVCCMPEDAEIITKNPLIRHITFIGSEPVGRKIALAAAENLIPTCIELGGKDCAVILPGTDLKFFGSTWMRSAFQANGQNCIGIERFIVHRSLYQSFIDLLLPRVKALRCGSSLSPPPGGASDSVEPVDCGAMVSSLQFDNLERLLSAAEKAGAKVLCGGTRKKHPVWTEGTYFEPTMLVDVSKDMEIAQHEIFAPVMTVMAYDTIEEAIEIANSTRYGLGSAVFGPNQTICRKVANGLQCGMVAVNDFGVFYLNQSMPFGGVKASGYGRFGGPEGIRSLCSQKVISEDRLFNWVRTSIPPPMDYPLPVQSKSWGFANGLSHLAFAGGLYARGKGIIGLLKNSF